MLCGTGYEVSWRGRTFYMHPLFDRLVKGHINITHPCFAGAWTTRTPAGWAPQATGCSEASFSFEKMIRILVCLKFRDFVRRWNFLVFLEMTSKWPCTLLFSTVTLYNTYYFLIRYFCKENKVQVSCSWSFLQPPPCLPSQQLPHQPALPLRQRSPTPLQH